MAKPIKRSDIVSFLRLSLQQCTWLTINDTKVLVDAIARLSQPRNQQKPQITPTKKTLSYTTPPEGLDVHLTTTKRAAELVGVRESTIGTWKRAGKVTPLPGGVVWLGEVVKAAADSRHLPPRCQWTDEKGNPCPSPQVGGGLSTCVVHSPRS